ncbi:sulfatase maturation enzyme AslB (radical SAM superfamily) [Paraburkholderia terricola]|uniref:radical SAM protein n=1 Tax=Paraburkholderia terricola TaxID=169427 RepID=UPI002864B123|nr:radical SAM protein [Paraburkholderia terricola]MDR6445518.1 sulfatase maturation enzyme AslB (radical SAM superfamily) [Paraburkholderia terricola]
MARTEEVRWSSRHSVETREGACDPGYKVVPTVPGIVKVESEDGRCYYDNVSLRISATELSRRSAELGQPLTALIPGSPFPDSLARKALSRLTLNVTQACNLRCTYCYAEYGKYGKKTSNVELDSFCEQLYKIIEYYSDIYAIQFFGGEPLLAMDKIAVACNLFTEAADRGLLLRKPKFNVVTNGVFLDRDEIIDFLLSKDFGITVSCDGPPEVTNVNRPSTMRAAGTYGKIAAGVRNAKSAGLNVAIEATYTKTHQHLGISVVDVLDFIWGDLDVPSVHVAPAASSPWGDLRPDVVAAKRDFYLAGYQSARRISSGQGGVLDTTISIFESLAKQERVKGYCPAYTSQLSLDIKGDAYPCFMSMNLEDTRLGNIIDDCWPNERSNRVFQRYRSDMESGPLSKRNNIWFDSLIVGCAAADAQALGRFGVDSDFDVHESIIAGSLIGLVSSTNTA